MKNTTKEQIQECIDWVIADNNPQALDDMLDQLEEDDGEREKAKRDIIDYLQSEEV